VSDWESLGVTGALLSRFEQDQQALLDQLAVFLESTLPRQTSVKRTHGVLGPRRTTGLTVDLASANQRYTLEHSDRSGLQASRTHVIRGVAVRTDPLSVADWLTEVSGVLVTELERTDANRAALDRLLHG
jgi:hypothetical protein